VIIRVAVQLLLVFCTEQMHVVMVTLLTLVLLVIADVTGTSQYDHSDVADNVRTSSAGNTHCYVQKIGYCYKLQ